MDKESVPCNAFFGRCFTAEGEPHEVSLDELGMLRSDDNALAWIDLLDPSEQMLTDVWAACGFPSEAKAFVREGTMPDVGQLGAHFWVRCVVVDKGSEKHKLTGSVLVCVAGRNRVVTLRRDALPFLDDMHHARHGRAAIGALSAESFVATLLDRHLASYFDAVSDYEMAIERIEVDLMGPHARDSLPELQRLRRWASRLRRMLAPHRSVFGVMSRPDFRPDEGKDADRHFVALDTRFERSMDMVEHARELVIGSFELFSSQTALRTNAAMRVLTFATVLIGILAVLAGVLGMNFDAAFFAAGSTGFWWTLGGMAALVAVAVGLARWRRWL